MVTSSRHTVTSYCAMDDRHHAMDDDCCQPVTPLGLGVLEQAHILSR